MLGWWQICENKAQNCLLGLVFRATASKERKILPELDMPVEPAALLSLKPLVPWRLLWLRSLRFFEVPPFDWMHANLEELRGFLLSEALAGRFTPSSGLPL